MNNVSMLSNLQQLCEVHCEYWHKLNRGICIHIINRFMYSCILVYVHNIWNIHFLCIVTVGTTSGAK